jgi:pilus assembly protein FimV
MALGLGDIQLDSKLNEPLRAHIPLLSVGNLSKEQILARLAKADEFQKAGLEYYTYMNWIRLKPVLKEDGQAYLELTTREPIKEPVVDLLIEVNWPNGRLQREYALLLDPPVFQSAANMGKSVVSQPEIGSSSVSQHDEFATRMTGTTDGTYGPVRQNDTLWSIAKRVRPDTGVTVHQTMVALYYANPDAFAGNNMNNLKAGSVLKLPDESSIKAVSQREALLEIARQNQLWAGDNRPGARPFGSVDTADYAGVGRQASSDARVRLSAPDGGDGEGSAAGSEEVVATLKAENEALRSEVEQTNERLAKLERLLELKDAELARLQQQSSNPAGEVAGNIGETDEAMSGPEHEESPTSQEDQDVQSDMGLPTTAANEDTSAGETASDIHDEMASSGTAESDVVEDVSTPETQSAEQVTETSSPALDAKQTTATQVTPADKGLMDELADMGMAFWSAVISGLGILIFGLVWFRKRRMESEAFQSSLEVPLEGDNSGDELPELADELLNPALEQDDFIPETEVEALEQVSQGEEEADPLGEADVYIAYGKFEQAKSLLERAIESEPDRVDLRLKLMECLGEMKARGEFEAQKEALEPLMATDDVIAEKVAEIERAAWPDEFGDEPEAEMPSVEDIFGDLAFAEQEASDPVQGSESADLNDGEEETTDAIDWEASDTDQISEPESTDDPGDALEESLDFDLELDGADDEASQQSQAWEPAEEDILSVEGEESEVTSDELGDMDDLSLEDDLLSADESPEFEEDELELGDADEISTKLDLARAYIDMEDFDSAREILNEVLEEGNDQQKAEARELMDQI